jgi:hypothetical protein
MRMGIAGTSLSPADPLAGTRFLVVEVVTAESSAAGTPAATR